VRARTGTGTIEFFVCANTVATERVGTLTIAGLTFTVTQAGRLAHVPNDIDGDGLWDLAVWRPGNGTWLSLTSGTGYANSGTKQWGSQSGGDVPKIADIDGDGASDLVVWRASTGTWYWLTSSTDQSMAPENRDRPAFPDESDFTSAS
jgi:hypothetical protein